MMIKLKVGLGKVMRSLSDWASCWIPLWNSGMKTKPSWSFSCLIWTGDANNYREEVGLSK